MILTVYGRMFSLWMYAAIAPILLSTFACEPTSSVGKNFIRSYAGVCLQGVVIALSCIIFSDISSSPPRCGYKRICCHRRLDLCRGTGIQPARTGGSHQGLRPHRQGNYGIVSCGRGFFVV